MYIQTAMHRLPIGSLAASQFSSSPLQLQMCTMALGYTRRLPQWLTDAEPSLPSEGCLLIGSLSSLSRSLPLDRLQFL